MPPVVFPRIAVAFLYGLYAALGIVAFILGIPTFDLTAPEGWTLIWGSVTSVLAGVGLVGLLSRKRLIERWGAGLISITLACYLGAALHLIATGNNSAGRGAFAVVLMIMMWFPVIQFMSLRKDSSSS